jgi:hypothetical protein
MKKPSQRDRALAKDFGMSIAEFQQRFGKPGSSKKRLAHQAEMGNPKGYKRQSPTRGSRIPPWRAP